MAKNKKPNPKDKTLKDFIKSGGRENVESDFNRILKRAVKPNKDSKLKSKK